VSKVILVGQAPGPREQGGILAGASGRRLAALAGMDLGDFLTKFERVNVLEQHPVDRGDADLAIARADTMRAGWAGRRVVLLGRSVAAAFRLNPKAYEWFEVMELEPGIEAAVIPHPSGISNWWNDPENVERAREFMMRIKLGFLAFNRKEERKASGRKEKFTPDQVAHALVANDGLMLYAAKLLAQETGLNCDRETISNYCDRYPDLHELRHQCKDVLGDIAEHNVMKAVRQGDPVISLKLLRSRAFAGRGYELEVRAKGDLHVSGTVTHEHQTLIESAKQRLINVLDAAPIHEAPTLINGTTEDGDG